MVITLFHLIIGTIIVLLLFTTILCKAKKAYKMNKSGFSVMTQKTTTNLRDPIIMEYIHDTNYNSLGCDSYGCVRAPDANGVRSLYNGHTYVINNLENNADLNRCVITRDGSNVDSDVLLNIVNETGTVVIEDIFDRCVDLGIGMYKPINGRYIRINNEGSSVSFKVKRFNAYKKTVLIPPVGVSSNARIGGDLYDILTEANDNELTIGLQKDILVGRDSYIQIDLGSNTLIDTIDIISSDETYIDNYCTISIIEDLGKSIGNVIYNKIGELVTTP